MAMLLHNHIIDSIAETGVYVGASIFDPTLVTALSARMQVLQAQGLLRAARIGRGAMAIAAPSVRNDSIIWLDQEQKSEAETTALVAVDALRGALNQALFLGLSDSEFHYAHYPRGARYQTHLDRFGDQDLRVISLVFYLNQQWGASDGGELVIYDLAKTPIASVLPRSGTMVAFLSADFPHEVLPALRSRSALTGWMRRRAFVGQ